MKRREEEREEEEPARCLPGDEWARPKPGVRSGPENEPRDAARECQTGDSAWHFTCPRRTHGAVGRLLGQAQVQAQAQAQAQTESRRWLRRAILPDRGHGRTRREALR